MMDQLYADLLAMRSDYNPAIYFKIGGYAQHDRFLGIRNPDLRLVAKKYINLQTQDLVALLYSEYNEHRALALMIMVMRYQKGALEVKSAMYNLYMEHINQVNNWNLVDLSAHYIVGAHCYAGYLDNEFFYSLIASDNLWHRRIAIVSMLYLIRNNRLDLPLDLSRRCLNDDHDLMHKATGWVLREIGKKNEELLVNFLHQHHTKMPRTALRYAIERLSADLRSQFVRVTRK